MARARVHQHVNPLARYFRQLPTKAVVLSEVFGDPELPIHIDVGCARGRFLLELAKSDGKTNFLGLEIREPLVIDANEARDREGLGNLHYVFCNATFDLEKLASRIPSGLITLVSIQFPDPWFKKRHAKRRMVNEALVASVDNLLSAGGTVVLQTDVDFLAEEMCDYFERTESFQISELDTNPFPVRTEREVAVRNKNKGVFRYRLVKEGV